MRMSDVKHYGVNIGIGVGVGMLAVAFMKNAQVWKSPNGGRIACIFANRVAANPLHINAGLVVAFSATVPQNYVSSGPMISTDHALRVALIACAALGLLLGAGYAYYTAPKAEEERKKLP